MNFGKNLRYLRKKWGYSQEDIAEKLGYKSYTTIQKWESGNSEPQVKVLNKIADMFNVSMNDLVAGDLENEEMGFALSEEEKEIIRMYRNVSTDAQKFIFQTIKAQQEPVKHKIPLILGVFLYKKTPYRTVGQIFTQTTFLHCFF